MEYFLIPGRHPALSASELWAVLEREGFAAKLSEMSGAILITADRDLPPDFPSWFGGMVKFGEMIGEVAPPDLAGFLADAVAGAEARDFGVSVYQTNASKRFKNLGLETKKILRERGTKSRWVSSREATLSSVVVATNKLLRPGIELCVFPDGERVRVGRTTAVQAFDEFSFRDYGRPRRDIRSGMLPIKLARILINLSRTPRDGVLLDPFCGSGTIVTEAAIMGFRNIIGSDISEQAVKNASANLEWVRRHFDISKNAARILRSPAEKIDVALRGTTVGGVATEPYLGPPLHGREPAPTIRRIISDLANLYPRAFAAIGNTMAPGANAAVVFPVFRALRKEIPLPILEELDRVGFKPSPLFPEGFAGSAGPRGSILYQRPDQRVLREVFVFERIIRTSHSAPGLGRH